MSRPPGLTHMSALTVAVLKRVKRGGSVGSAFVEEWTQQAPRGTAEATAEALLRCGAGYVCATCRIAFVGEPSYVRGSSESCQVFCIPCGEVIERHSWNWWGNQ